jgi:transposase
MNTYSLGIDLHKHFAYWTLINAERKILWEGKVPTDGEKTKSAALALPVPKEACRAVIEPVDLWGWYAELLEECGLTVVLANSLQVSLIAKSKLKYDKIDSKILAELLQTGYMPVSYLAPRETRDVRELLRSRISLVAIRTRLKNRIHTVLSKEGKMSPVTDLFGKKGLAWIGEQTLRPVHRSEVDSYLRVMETIDRELNSMKKEIEVRAKHDADTVILQTIPGVGPFTALLIKAEVGTFDRFPTPESLASFSGLIASSRSSGGKLHYGRITKQGSRYLRWSLVQAAAKVNSTWGDLATFHERIKEKKGVKIARVALARKMLTTAWYLVKKKEPFRASSLGTSGNMNR